MHLLRLEKDLSTSLERSNKYRWLSWHLCQNLWVLKFSPMFYLKFKVLCRVFQCCWLTVKVPTTYSICLPIKQWTFEFLWTTTHSSHGSWINFFSGYLMHSFFEKVTHTVFLLLFMVPSWTYRRIVGLLGHTKCIVCLHVCFFEELQRGLKILD